MFSIHISKSKLIYVFRRCVNLYFELAFVFFFFFVPYGRISSSKILTDSELVEDVIKDVYEKLHRTERVGIYSKVLEIENLLYKQPWDVRSIGIWGMPGIGKTTLAKAVFKHMSSDYDVSCFIENFDEAFHKEGLHRLLEKKLVNF